MMLNLELYDDYGPDAGQHSIKIHLASSAETLNIPTRPGKSVNLGFEASSSGGTTLRIVERILNKTSLAALRCINPLRTYFHRTCLLRSPLASRYKAACSSSPSLSQLFKMIDQYIDENVVYIIISHIDE